MRVVDLIFFFFVFVFVFAFFFLFYERRVAKAGIAVDTAGAAGLAASVALNGAATFVASCERTTETESATDTKP